jgi:hypothetical protein
MTELIDFPKLPPNAVMREWNCHGEWCFESVKSAWLLSPERDTDRLIIGYTMAGQWQDEWHRLFAESDEQAANQAYEINQSWRKWARGEEWK